MADACLETIVAWDQPGQDQPPSLRPEHLASMCQEISRHAGDWPSDKLHRWLGFVQGAMVANRMLDLAGARQLFEDAERAFGQMDQDLLDHLDPTSLFELDIGGPG